ncbi:phage baseplate assembly protein V [Actinobacillus pleuropneumoniae]|uniref:phage baseplate assembly protein V n=1 Tax=Actinobacillus pleuropneumoniae TaxID=715 RepID=UPI00223E8AAB|nr:phage baseplate assembly protein V [Actinobacillus pleuropneumoniae]
MRKLAQQVKQVVKNVNETVRTAFRGVLNLVNSSADVQKVQVSGLADETIADLDLMQHFGFTSVPPSGTQAVIIPLGGKTSHGVIVATENGSFRIKGLQNGETAIYDASGSSIILKNGKLIEIACDTLKINCQTYEVSASSGASFKTPKLETDQVFTAQGQINGNGGMAVQGGSGASFSGNVKQSGGSFATDGDVKAGSVSLKTHAHENDGRGKPMA